MKIKHFIIIFITLSLLSCGTTNIFKPETGEFQNLKLQNNTLTFNTIDSVFVNISFGDVKGWSAGNKKVSHNYLLPMESGQRYNIKIELIKNDKVVKDTTLVNQATTNPVDDFLRVHFIDVAQGDAILIQTPDQKNIQIDGGYGTRRHQGNPSWDGGGVPLALNYLKSKNITHLDYIIETHRHLDHWGGLNDILNSDITSGPYISNASNPLNYTTGSMIYMSDTVNFQVLNFGYPPGVPQNDLNNTSIVLRATYGDAEFLFTGDAEGHVQDWIFSQNLSTSVDVLKVSHHGSRTDGTSNTAFLSRTLNQFAKIAVISYGAGNIYEHPHDLQRFRNFNTYGTNSVKQPPAGQNYKFDCGTILVETDGKIIFVSTEK